MPDFRNPYDRCNSILLFLRYLIDKDWFKQMNKYLESGEDNPGPIDNSPLFKTDPSEPFELRPLMIDELDYFLVHEKAWGLLVQTFALAFGQEAIARKVNTSV